MDRLRPFLKRIGDKVAANWYEIRDLQYWMVEEVYRKRTQFPYWKKKVLFSWVSFNKKIASEKKRKAISDEKQISLFFFEKFEELFTYFLTKIYPFNEKHLVFEEIDGFPIDTKDTFYKCTYQLDYGEYKIFEEFVAEFKLPEHPIRVMEYLFNSIFLVFEQLILENLKLKIQIRNLSTISKLIEDKQLIRENNLVDEMPYLELSFLIVVRKSDLRFIRAYLWVMIFHFAEILPNIEPRFLNYLRKRRDEIYPLALTEYPKALEYLDDVLFTLQKRSVHMESCTPLLDITNFICSRVEDSIFKVEPLVHEIILEKYPKNPYFRVKIENLFNYVNTTASLFSTFQSNNRANLSRQYQLFYAYTMYFCSGGVQMMKINPAFLFLDKIKEELDKNNFKKKYSELNDKVFFNFILNGPALHMDKGLNHAFQRIFNNNIFELNEQFFESFLQSANISFNKKVQSVINTLKIRGKNKNLTTKSAYSQVIHAIIVILHNLVKKIFIGDTPESVQKHFHDQLTRYTSEQIALRMLELRIFKDIPLSDNTWQDYYLSRNKNLVKKVFRNYYEIPDSYFFSPKRLLKINMIYELGPLKTTPYLEEWIINNIVIPFYEFENKIEKQIGKEKNYKEYREAIVEELNRGIIDEELRDKIEDFADQFAMFWE